MSSDVKVFENGCIRLGSSITADGFVNGFPFRFQSHFHLDHMTGFDKSLLRQKKIICTPLTYKFLCAVNPGIPHRKSRMLVIEPNGQFKVIPGSSVRVALHDTVHMPGSAMIEIIEPTGEKFAYLSDFSSNIISYPDKPDVLVIDSTNGDPVRERAYDFGTLNGLLVDEVRDSLGAANVVSLVGHSSNLFRALRVLSNSLHHPFCYPRKLNKFFEAFCELDGISAKSFELGSEEYSKRKLLGDPFILLADRSDDQAIAASSNTRKIHLFAGSVGNQEPVNHRPNGDIHIAYSEHADLAKALEIISKISPKQIICDRSRSGSADDFAAAIRQRLRIDARSESVMLSRDMVA
jgi:putative mRNA 3-end processing factor